MKMLSFKKNYVELLTGEEPCTEQIIVVETYEQRSQDYN